MLIGSYCFVTIHSTKLNFVNFACRLFANQFKMFLVLLPIWNTCRKYKTSQTTQWVLILKRSWVYLAAIRFTHFFVITCNKCKLLVAAMTQGRRDSHTITGLLVEKIEKNPCKVHCAKILFCGHGLYVFPLTGNLQFLNDTSYISCHIVQLILFFDLC